MTSPIVSGIYKITFPSGKTYIGKSIDFYTRIKQHHDKFKKGTAAKPMQEQFNAYRNFQAECVFECHADHIDIMEAVFISRLNPDLNTSRPVDPFPGVTGKEFDDICAWFSESTYQHVTKLIKNKYTIHRLQEECAEYIDELDQLEKKRTKEEIESAAGVRLHQALVDIKELKDLTKRAREYDKDQIEKLKQHIHYLEMPWWKKLF